MALEDLDEWNHMNGSDRAFTVGTCIKGRASLAAQMLSAYRFASVLEKQNAVAGKTFIVVGGGPIGIATAAELIERQASLITIVDGADQCLTKLSRAHHRRLYPAINEWPRPLWTCRSYGELCAASPSYKRNPLIDWEMGTAPEVGATFQTHLERLKKTGRVDVKTGVVARCAADRGDQVSVSLQGIQTLLADYAVYCIGYGDEVLDATLGTPSYWDPAMPSPERLVIVGNGDGAFIDAIKFMLSLGEESTLFDLMLAWKEQHPSEYNSVSEQVLKLELDGMVSPKLFNQHLFNEIFGSQVGLQDLIKPRLSAKGRRVVLVHDTEDLITGRVAPIYLCLFKNILSASADKVEAFRARFSCTEHRFEDIDAAPRSAELNSLLRDPKASMILRIGAAVDLPPCLSEEYVRYSRRFSRISTIV